MVDPVIEKSTRKCMREVPGSKYKTLNHVPSSLPEENGRKSSSLCDTSRVNRDLSLRIQVCPKKGIGPPTFLFFSDGIGTQKILL